MKRHPHHKNTPGELSHSLNERLNLYALSATAAGVSLLAFAQPAEASILFTPVHKIIGPHGSYAIDLNHDGLADFAIRNLQRCDIDNTCTSFVSAVGYGANRVEGTRGTQFSPPLAYALKAGATISGQHPFYGVKMAGAGQTTAGNWYNVTNRFLGLRFEIGGEPHFGWARLTVRLRFGFAVELTGFAYETVPNKPIIAGTTADTANQSESLAPSSGGSNTGTLGALATGASVLDIWRRKESPHTAQ